MLKKISFLSLFPEVIQHGLNYSLIHKAISQKKIEVEFIQIRDFAKDKHQSVDDTLVGGGPGMLLKPDVLFDAWSFAASRFEGPTYTVLLSPQGALFQQNIAKQWVNLHEHLILICGHYEGVDERFIEHCVDEEISIGDYVLTGGEIPALVLSDVLIRLLPGVVGNGESVSKDSLEDGLLKHPQYTKPRDFQGMQAPEILFSGNHAQIEAWRKEQSIERTKIKRPDLWEKYLKWK